MMTHSILNEKKENGVTILTINRPDSMNTMNGALVEALQETFTRISHDKETRVIILTAAGERAFCAGADLVERRTMSEEEVAQRIQDYRKAFHAIENVNQPVICAINGYAFGGGLEIALACDIRIMAKETKIGLTETRIGIIPGAGGTQRLPRIVGEAKAKELIFMAKRLDAQEAYSIGLVNFVAEGPELMQSALDIALQIKKNAPIAVREAKKAIHLGMQTDIASGIQIESECYARTIPTADRLEGLAAFKEKREPNWRNE